MRRLRGLAATFTVIGILIGIPALLLMAGTLPDSVPSWDEMSAALRTPDDGTIALGAITVVGWGAWLVLACAIVAELVARLRGVAAPRLPRGMGWAQGIARSLIAAAAVTFAVAGPASAYAATTPGTVVTQNTTTVGAHTAASRTAPASPVVAPTAQSVQAVAGWTSYTVQRGDTLWSLAAARLGDGAKYRQIADANRDILGTQPGFLEPGWVLLVPPVPSTPSAGEVVVKAGDTLSGIAAERLGDPDRYPELATATAEVIQPGGDRLTDPDHIEPGWRIVIPEAAHPVADATTIPTAESKTPAINHIPDAPGPASVAPAPDVSHAVPAGTQPSLIAPSRASATVPPSVSRVEGPAPDATTRPFATSHGPRAAWVVAGLTGAGTILAGTVLMTLRRRRQAQFRARRPGRAVPAVEPELIPLEKTVTTYGAAAAVAVETLDAQLRVLAQQCADTGDDLPDLAAVELSDTTVTMHLASPGDLPPPWQPVDQTRQRWHRTTSKDDDNTGDDLADQPAPWPMLATIGSGPDGHLWLLNIEAYPLLHVLGAREPGLDFVRHIAAELATSPWSRDLTIDCVGLLPELSPLNPHRLRHHEDAGTVLPDAARDAEDRARHAEDLKVTRMSTGRAHQVGDELWPAHLVILDPITADAGDVDALAEVLRRRGATGATLLLTGGETTANPMATAVVLGEDQVTLPDFGLTLTPVRLSAAEGAGCAALLAGRALLQDDPMPAPVDPGAAWEETAAVDGSLREDLVLDRHDTSDQDANRLLPAPDDAYLQVAATTPDDLAALAPRVPASLRASIEEADPTLDADVAAWRADRCDLPRLSLLGPVQARTNGDIYAVTDRKPYYTEVLAWLALHPHGGTRDQLADAFGITANRVRVDIKAVRDWLGDNPRTGTQHIPDARQSAAGRAQGRGIYQVDGLLCDLDLFRRLRARGQARGGEHGMTDLANALTLVTGQPFTGTREQGWAWLAEGDRLDQHMVCAIVDVAHLVATDALHKGNLALARAAAEVAAQAAPYEDTPRLDLAAIARAEGRPSVAEDIIRDDICNRSDEPGLPPTELPARTRAILAARPLTAKAS